MNRYGEPRTFVPSKRIKAAKPAFGEDGSPMSLRRFVREIDPSSPLHNVAQKWFANKRPPKRTVRPKADLASAPVAAARKAVRR